MMQMLLEIPNNLAYQIKQLENPEQFIVQTLCRALNLTSQQRELDSLIGTWTEKDAQDFFEYTQDFSKIDTHLWD